MADEPSTTEPAERPSRGPAPPDDSSSVEAARREVEALTSRIQYLQADFDNFRKRMSREVESVVRYAQEGLLVRLLPVLDELDAAAETASGGSRDGIRMVRDNLLKALRDAGLEEIPALGVPFDPYVHEAVERLADSPASDGTVTAVVRKGYRLRDRILRPAQVIVATRTGDPHAENHRN